MGVCSHKSLSHCCYPPLCPVAGTQWLSWWNKGQQHSQGALAVFRHPPAQASVEGDTITARLLCLACQGDIVLSVQGVGGSLTKAEAALLPAWFPRPGFWVINPETRRQQKAVVCNTCKAAQPAALGSFKVAAES